MERTANSQPNRTIDNLLLELRQVASELPHAEENKIADANFLQLANTLEKWSHLPVDEALAQTKEVSHSIALTRAISYLWIIWSTRT